MFLPYVSSAFVPPETMPAALEAIARHQPITPITETVRALLMGGSTGGDAIVALAWCAGGIAVGSVAAALLFRSRNRGEGRP
jgi:ABC-2 type transport system permease protein